MFYIFYKSVVEKFKIIYLVSLINTGISIYSWLSFIGIYTFYLSHLLQGVVNCIIYFYNIIFKIFKNWGYATSHYWYWPFVSSFFFSWPLGFFFNFVYLLKVLAFCFIYFLYSFLFLFSVFSFDLYCPILLLSFGFIRWLG